MHDPKCRELAAHFLSDEDILDADRTKFEAALADVIQGQIEDWCAADPDFKARTLPLVECEACLTMKPKSQVRTRESAHGDCFACDDCAGVSP